MQRSVKFLIGVLTVSVILNFAFAGFIATQFIRDRAFHQFSALTETEPPPALRTAFREALRIDRRALQGAVLDLRDARDRQHDILIAERFDSAAIAAAQQETRAATVALTQVLHSALRTAASKLPNADRRAIPKFRASGLIDHGEASIQRDRSEMVSDK